MKYKCVTLITQKTDIYALEEIQRGTFAIAH